MISPEQCKAGRAVLGWSQDDLSTESKVSTRTIQEFEAGAREPNKTTLQALLSALERNGIAFGPNGASLSWGSLRGITPNPVHQGKAAEIE